MLALYLCGGNALISGAGGNVKLPEGDASLSVGGSGGVDIDGKVSKPDVDLSGKGPDASIGGGVSAPDADVKLSLGGKKKSPKKKKGGFHSAALKFINSKFRSTDAQLLSYF